MKVLHVMRSVNPEGGGPIEAIVQSDPVWRRLGHSREIVSLDLPGDPWVAGCPIPTHPMGSWRTDRARRAIPLLRYGATRALVPWLRARITNYDTVIVNGLWNYATFAARRVLPGSGRRYVVFPHGMLDPWFRRAYPRKHWAKQLSWWLCEGPLLRGADAVLFTSEGERDSAAGAFWPYRVNPRVSGYGTADPPAPCSERTAAFRALVPRLGRRPYLLFLARLHPKKGCDLLLRAFAGIASRHPDLDLVMAGPDPDGWGAALRTIAAQGGIAARVHWPGMVRDDAKWGALHGCEAFVLPSHGENFGIAVAEALACGRPVLISDRIAIAPDILGDRAGLVAADTDAGIRDLLDRFLHLPDLERAAMGARARSCFLRRYVVDRVAEDALALLGAAS